MISITGLSRPFVPGSTFEFIDDEKQSWVRSLAGLVSAGALRRQRAFGGFPESCVVSLNDAPFDHDAFATNPEGAFQIVSDRRYLYHDFPLLEAKTKHLHADGQAAGAKFIIASIRSLALRHCLKECWRLTGAFPFAVDLQQTLYLDTEFCPLRLIERRSPIIWLGEK